MTSLEHNSLKLMKTIRTLPLVWSCRKEKTYQKCAAVHCRTRF